MGPGQQGDSPTAVIGALRQARPPVAPRRQRGSRGPLVPVAAAAAALVVLGGAYLAFRPHSSSPTASSTTTTAGTTPSASASAASSSARRQAATGLATLLAQSVSDRAAVIDAVVDARGCGPALVQDKRIFAKAASSRDLLLSRLGNMSGRSVLSPEMLQDLTGAWQASAQADSDLAQWAGSLARSCHRNRTANASLSASYGPDGEATADKKAFANLWDPVARQYGLTAYQWDQL